MASKEYEVNNNNINMDSDESNGSNLNDEEEEDDIVDLDFETNPEPEVKVEDKNPDEIDLAKSPIPTQNNIMSTVQNTAENKKTMKKNEYFSPKSNSTIGKLFINNTTNLVTEENANSAGNMKTEQNAKTVLSKVK